jgi:hypothetical protein
MVLKPLGHKDVWILRGISKVKKTLGVASMKDLRQLIIYQGIK